MKEQFHDTEPKRGFSIDPHGAYLTQLHTSEGQPILFDRTTIDGKTRGGCHVCLPNFGPDSSGELAQHGFGRTVDWQVVRDEGDVVELRMPQVEGDYAGLEASMIYAYDADASRCTMRLEVSNSGTTPLRVAPAFHPYFAVGEDEPVRLNGELLDTSAYEGTEFVEGISHELAIGERQLTLESDELTTWALWSDNRGGYFCVEPSEAGPSFINDSPRPDELFAPGEQWSYEFRISW